MLTVGPVEIHYETGGVATAPRVLYITGTGGDLRVHPGPLDSPLASQFSLLAYDQRGLGQSSVPPGPYTMAEYADDAAALLDRLGWAGAAVMGVSFGGMVAQELALRHPGVVTRLVLACTSSGGPGGASYPLHELAALPPEERIVRQIELSDRRMDGAWRAAHPTEWERALAFSPRPRHHRGRRAGPGARRPAPTRGPAGPRHMGPPRCHRLPDPGLRRTV